MLLFALGKIAILRTLKCYGINNIAQYLVFFFQNYTHQYLQDYSEGLIFSF